MKYPMGVRARAAYLISSRRQTAFEERDRKLDFIQQEHSKVAKLKKEVDRANFLYSHALYLGEDTKELKERADVLQGNLDAQLREIGLDLTPPFTCPVCEDRGKVDGKYCTCMKQLMNRIIREQLSDPYQSDQYTFDTFDLDLCEPAARPVMGRILQAAKGYAERFARTNASLLFLGATGLGKTHLSLAIAQKVADTGHPVIYASAPRLLGRLESAKFKDDPEAEAYRQAVYSCDLLVVDDLGAEMGTRYTQAEVYDLINARLNETLATIINTNLTPEEISARYTDRVLSRLVGAYTVVSFKGKDVRIKKRLEGNGRGHKDG